MLNAVIRLSLRYRPLVVVFALVLLVYGGYLATTLPIDVFPDLDRPRVVIMTEAVGYAPEEVEALITFPLESAVLGAGGVQDVRTQSGPGLSVVFVEFSWGTDIRVARQVVQERLATVAGDMPPGVTPQLAPVSSIMGQILISGLRRQPGPKGGELMPIPGTPHYAERVRTEGKSPDLYAWTPTDRTNPAVWIPVTTENAEWRTPDVDGAQAVKATVDGKVVDLTFPSGEQRQLALRTLAEWVVRPAVLKVSGVAQVIPMGGGRKQYQVLVDPAALAENQVTLGQVEKALRDNNVNFSGGFAEDGGTEKPIRVLGRLGPRPEQVVSDLKQVPIRTTDKRTILLEQVARITEGAQQKRGDASVNGYPAVALTVTKQPGVDTRLLTEKVKAAIHDAESSLPADVVVEDDLFELRGFIDRGVYNVGEALVIGAVLVLIVLFLFLLNFRTTFISLTAIPLSLVITAVVFKLVGWLTGSQLTINVMTLGGIAVAMGELVDDAIVDVENIFRRLRENAHLSKPRPSLRVVYEASKEVRTAIVFGTAVVIMVFLPLFALSGIAGRLFTPLGIAYIVSILASLLVSLTVTPVLSSYLLAGSKAVHREKDGWLVRGLKWMAGHLVRLSMRRAGLLLLLTWLVVAYCGWRVTTLGSDFLPEFNEGSVQVNIALPPGASLAASNEATAAVDAKLRAMRVSPTNPDGLVVGFVRRTGRAEMDEHTEPPSTNEYVISLNPHALENRQESIAKLRQAVQDEVVGADVEVEQPLQHLINHMISGSTAQIAIKIYGDDLDTLEQMAEQIKTVVGGLNGVSSVAVEPMRKVDEIHINLRPDALAYHGVDRRYVGEFVQTALRGEVVSQVLEGQRRFDLLVRLEEPYRADVANLGELRLDLPALPNAPSNAPPRQVRLKELADITPPTGGDTGANQIKRDNIRRRIVVRVNAAGRDLGGVVSDIRKAVEESVPKREGYVVEYGGQFESQEEAARLIAVLGALSGVGMFFVLLMLFSSRGAMRMMLVSLLVGGAVAAGVFLLKFGPVWTAVAGTGAFFLTTAFFPSARVVLQILNAIPTAFIGGVLALVITGQTLTVASMVGFISLGGIAVRNGILLVTHYVHLMKEEGEGFTEKMVLRGSLERLSPVLMTALTAGIGLIPLVVEGNKPGREILYPVATVILGGLLTSTFCEFFLHPGLFWRFSGKAAAELAQDQKADDGLDDPAPAPEPIPLQPAAG